MWFGLWLSWEMLQAEKRCSEGMRHKGRPLQPLASNAWQCRQTEYSTQLRGCYGL